MNHIDTEIKKIPADRVWIVFLIFLRLGLTSFGGPVAHLGYFRQEFVVRRRWLSERSYVDLMALCQFLPGPSSSQVGMALGMIRAGYAGALAAWAGFTLPAATLLTVLAWGLSTWGGMVPHGLLHGLKIVAVAVVAQAVWGMAKNLCVGIPRMLLMLTSAAFVLFWSTALGQVSVILMAALVGVIFFKPEQAMVHDPLPISTGRKTGAVMLLIFIGLLFGLPALYDVWPDRTLAVINVFYRAGSLVFGGGHVVLPLLQSAVVPAGWVSNDTFLAGYGLTQAMPGPLFAFSSFLGASMNGWAGSVTCLVAIFVPGFLLVFGALPFWEQLRTSKHTQAALSGVNASVVGLLLAALYHPVWSSAIFNLMDFGIAVLGFVALMLWRLPPWFVVAGGGLAGWLAL